MCAVCRVPCTIEATLINATRWYERFLTTFIVFTAERSLSDGDDNRQWYDTHHTHRNRRIFNLCVVLLACSLEISTNHTQHPSHPSPIYVARQNFIRNPFGLDNINNALIPFVHKCIMYHCVPYRRNYHPDEDGRNDAHRIASQHIFFWCLFNDNGTTQFISHFSYVFFFSSSYYLFCSFLSLYICVWGEIFTRIIHIYRRTPNRHILQFMERC